MSWRQKVIRVVNRLLARKGYEIARIVADTAAGYRENPVVGSRNLVEKQARVERGEHFEWPNLIALNQAVARFIGPAKQIVNIGAGTGTFEWFVAVDTTLELVASEFDEECVRWCRENRDRENIIWCSSNMKELLERYGEFDLAISVDVIEHVGAYGEFLQEFSRLANRAILTTPNKARDHHSLTAAPPSYYQHVREWTAGEFYWVLKAYYSKVDLYAMPDPYVPQVDPVGLHTKASPLVAVCSR